MRAQAVATLVAAALVAAALVALAPAAGQAGVEREETIVLHEFDGGGMHLEPEIVYAKVGDTLVLAVQNPSVNELDHNLVVCGDPPHPEDTCDDTMAFTPSIPPGEERVLRVALDKAGDFEYFCSIVGHKSATPGMAGTLNVTARNAGVPDKAESPAPGAILAILVLAAVAVVAGRR